MTRIKKSRTIKRLTWILSAAVSMLMLACTSSQEEPTIGTTSAALEGNPPICILGENTVDLKDRAAVAADVVAGVYLEIGSQAVLTGDGYVGGDSLIRSNGTVDGDLSLAGVLSDQGGYTITGDLAQNASLDLPTLEVKTLTAGGDPTTVGDGETLAPGTYGDVAVADGAAVTLSAGVYNLLSLHVYSNADLILDGDVEINVVGDLELGDSSEVLGDAALEVYVDGAAVNVWSNVTFSGILVAPNAMVHIFSNTTFNGCVGGENITLEPDVTFDSNGLRLVDEEPTCDDGIQNGDEEGIDCGGTFCAACPTCDDGVQNGDEEGVDCGGSCPDECEPTCDDGIQNGDEEGIDCGGTNCAACPTCDDGILNGDEEDIDCGGSCPACPEDIVDLSVTFDIFTDWGTGYCAFVDVTNNGTIPSTTWSLTFDTNGTWIYTDWNGDFTDQTGEVTVTPWYWNSVIAPEETISSIGFCAFRFAGGSNLPTVVSVTGE